MSTEAVNARKRKPTEVPVSLINNDVQNSKESKSRRVSTDASSSTLTVASHQTTDQSSAANATSATIATPESSMESIGQMIQDLIHSNNAKVIAALFALDWDINSVENDCELKERFVMMQAAGGSLALVQVVKDCLKKITERILAGGG
jgi:hypothetical protein